MPSWNNADLRVFHGTDATSIGATRIGTKILVPDLHIDLTSCRENTDFGKGFYTTTSVYQAKQWANRRYNRNRKVQDNFAVVLQFEIERDRLAALESLSFVRSDTDYWNLVGDCRSGVAPHQRKDRKSPLYDVVHGPVSLWPQRLVIADCDQLSFHTAAAIELLRPALSDWSTTGAFQ